MLEAGLADHEQGGGGPVGVQPHDQVVLELLVDQCDGLWELFVAQGHPVFSLKRSDDGDILEEWLLDGKKLEWEEFLREE